MAYPNDAVLCLRSLVEKDISMNALQFCEGTIQMLKPFTGHAWAGLFNAQRMRFQREYLKGVVCSTLLGADFFEFTARALRGEEQERLYKPAKDGGEFQEGYNLEYRKWLERERKTNFSTLKS